MLHRILLLFLSLQEASSLPFARSPGFQAVSGRLLRSLRIRAQHRRHPTSDSTACHGYINLRRAKAQPCQPRTSPRSPRRRKLTGN